jgi:hypothetical protein
VLVQEPATAKFDGMPRSAIDVDFDLKRVMENLRRGCTSRSPVEGIISEMTTSYGRMGGAIWCTMMLRGSCEQLIDTTMNV